MKNGFTLVELLITITIIGVLSSIGVASYQQVQKNARDARRVSDLRGLQSALEQYRSDQFYYPASITMPASGSGGGSAFTSSIGVGAAPTPSPLKTYLNTIPAEPSSDRPVYLYRALPLSCDNTTGAGHAKCINYCLFVAAEALPITSPIPTGCDFPSPQPNPAYTYVITSP